MHTKSGTHRDGIQPLKYIYSATFYVESEDVNTPLGDRCETGTEKYWYETDMKLRPKSNAYYMFDF